MTGTLDSLKGTPIRYISTKDGQPRYAFYQGTDAEGNLLITPPSTSHHTLVVRSEILEGRVEIPTGWKAEPLSGGRG